MHTRVACPVTGFVCGRRVSGGQQDASVESVGHGRLCRGSVEVEARWVLEWQGIEGTTGQYVDCSFNPANVVG